MRQYRIKESWHNQNKCSVYIPQFKLWGIFWINLCGVFACRDTSWFAWRSHAEEIIDNDIEFRKKQQQKPTYYDYPNK